MKENLTVDMLLRGLKASKMFVVSTNSAYGNSKAVYRARPFEYLVGTETGNLSGFAAIHGCETMANLQDSIKNLNNASACSRNDGCHGCTLSAGIMNPMEMNIEFIVFQMLDLLEPIKEQFCSKDGSIYMYTFRETGYTWAWVAQCDSIALDVYGDELPYTFGESMEAGKLWFHESRMIVSE